MLFLVGEGERRLRRIGLWVWGGRGMSGKGWITKVKVGGSWWTSGDPVVSHGSGCCG